MQEKKLTFEEIDALGKRLKTIFYSLETEIAIIDDRFKSTALDFMYGNISENYYNERMEQLRMEMIKVKQKLNRIQEFEDSVP